MSTRDTVLATIEASVRSVTANKLRSITTAYTAALRAGFNSNPSAGIDEIISSAEAHRMLTDALAGASTAVQTAIRAGYRAGARQARTEAGTDTGGTEADDTAYLDSILADVRTAFAAASIDIVDSVRAADDHTQDPASRVDTAEQATDRAVRRLNVRIAAAAVVAVHRGYTDAQVAGFARLGNTSPYLNLRKRWEVTSTSPCPACAGLHGSIVGVDEEFDHEASDDPGFAPPKVYRDLHGPPRHPNCRCRIVLEPSEASAQLQTEAARRPPAAGSSSRLSAADIRRMPSTRYNALMKFLTATYDRLTALIRKIRDGG